MSSLIIDNLSKVYSDRGRSVQALRNVSVEMADNRIYGLLGKNGSGKTTLIKACTNLITYQGSIRLKENDSLRALGYKDYSAVLEGNRNVYWRLSPLENIRFFTGIRGIRFDTIKADCEQMLHDLALDGKKDTIVANLSRGMQQKVAIACALLSNPRLLFLDEPTLGLDVESRKQLETFLANSEYLRNRIVLVSSHDMGFIRNITESHLYLKDGVLSLLDINKLKNTLYKLRVISSERGWGDVPVLRETAVNDRETELIIDTAGTSLSHCLEKLESAGIPVVEVLQLNRDLESIYLGVEELSL